MELGYTTMNTPEDPPPAELARVLEDRGYGSLWIGEHSHIPVSRRTPYPAGGDMPAQYTRMMDPFISLALAAAATERLLLATGVALPLEHDLFALAKTVATLDHASGGRVVFGVGVGWNEEELADHRPIPWAARYRALAECVAALRALWCDDEAEFHGEFFDFDPVWIFPKPLQRPHPPIVIGGLGERRTLRTVARWADHWNYPSGGVEVFEKKRQVLVDHCEQLRRDPGEIITSTHLRIDPADVGAVADQAAAFADAGLDLGIVSLQPPHTPAVLGPLAEALAPLAGS